MSKTAEKPWVTTTRSGETNYHQTSECDYLDQSSTHPRTQAYVDYHNLRPCRNCVETVWIVTGGNRRNIYHTDRDCPNLTGASRPINEKTRHELPNYDACQTAACQGEETRDRTEEWECLKCGETMAKQSMSYHLRGCTGGDADA